MKGVLEPESVSTERLVIGQPPGTWNNDTKYRSVSYTQSGRLRGDEEARGNRTYSRNGNTNSGEGKLRSTQRGQERG